MADEGNESRIRRMDLNLYLGLPRSPRPRSLDLGSDLALSSLPLSTSSTTEESRAPLEMPGSMEPSDSHAPYSPSHASFTPSLLPVDPLPRTDVNSSQEYTPYFPSFEPYGQSYDPIPAIMPDSEGPNTLYSPSAVHPLPTVQGTDELMPYDPLSPPGLTDASLPRGHESHVPYSPPYVPASVAEFLAPDDGGTSSRQDLFESPDFVFGRSNESNQRWRLRRFRSTLPYSGDRSNFERPSATSPEQLMMDIMRSQRALGTNGKHKVPAEGIASEGSGSEDDAEEKSKSTANFECNICLEMAKEPVVTSCGHLFCWPCLYQWLHLHCEHKECPVCKGEVTDANMTPIYGRGSLESSDEKKLTESGESGLKIPPRPHGNRLESLRQQFRPISRRLGEGIVSSFRRIANQHMRNRNRFDGRGDPSVQGMLNGGHTVLTRLTATRILRGEEGNPEAGREAEDIRLPRDNTTIPQSSDTNPPFRDGIDLWHGFSVYGIAADRLAAITADLGRVVGSSSRFRASTSSVNPPSPEQLIPRQNLPATPVQDQASASSTTAMIQGDIALPDASVENGAGSSRSYRRRGRSSASGSLDVDGGVLHARKRRRLN